MKDSQFSLNKESLKPVFILLKISSQMGQSTDSHLMEPQAMKQVGMSFIQMKSKQELLDAGGPVTKRNGLLNLS